MLMTRGFGCDGRLSALRNNCLAASRSAESRKSIVAPPEYVVVHEMLHLIAPTHSEQFLALMSKHYPTWREARAELNELPLASVSWKE